MVIPTSLVILLPILAVAAWMWRKTRSFPAHRPEQRPGAIRYGCAALGAIVALAMVIETLRWEDAIPADRQAQTAHVGQGPVDAEDPAGPLPTKDNAAGIAGERALLRLAIVQTIGDIAIPVHYCEYELLWPRDQNRVIEGDFGGDPGDRGVDGIGSSSSVHVRLSIEGASRPLDVVHGRISLSVRSGMFGSAQYQVEDGWYASLAGASREIPQLTNGSSNPLSLVPTSYRSGRISFVSIVSPLRSTDRLMEVPVEQVIDLASTSPSGRDGNHVTVSGESRSTVSVSDPGLAFFAHLGLASFVLIVAAVLIAQAFRWRMVGMACATTVLVLQAVVLEHIALGSQLRVIEDRSAPIQRRINACGLAQRSFFFQRTLNTRLAAVRADATTPPALRAISAGAIAGF